VADDEDDDGDWDDDDDGLLLEAAMVVEVVESVVDELFCVLDPEVFSLFDVAASEVLAAVLFAAVIVAVDVPLECSRATTTSTPVEAAASAIMPPVSRRTRRRA
jgi:hypothetical protein